MTSPLRVVGIDPGPVPGFVIIERGFETLAVDVVQCTHSLAPTVLAALLEDRRTPTVVQIETFVPGRNARKAGQASAVTRDLVGTLRQIWEDFDSTPSGRLGGRWFQRTAAQVKPWASDTRLQACTSATRDQTLWTATAGMRHARDAGRHALYAAVHDAGLPDPLSKDWSR